MDRLFRALPSQRAIRQYCWLIGLVVLLICVASYQFVEPKLLNDIEGRLLDARFQLRGESAATDAVAIVAIDDASLQTIGRWPWPRDRIAQLIEKTHHAGAAAIGLDILFAEPSRAEWMDALLRSSQLSPDTRRELEAAVNQHPPDQVLADSIRAAGTVVTGNFFFTDPEQIKSKALPTHYAELMARSTVTAVKSRLESFTVTEAPAVTPNIPLIASAGLGSGFFNTDPGTDGVVRRMPLVIKYRDDLYPSLAVKLLSAAMGTTPIIVNVEEYGIANLNVGGHRVDTDEAGRVILNYRGAQGRISTYSARDVLNQSLAAGALKDRIVLIGVPAVGVSDVRATPFAPSFPGVEIQATSLDNMLNNDFIVVNNLANFTDLFTLLCIVVLLSWIVPKIQSMWHRAAFTIGVLLVYIVINVLAFVQTNNWINMVYPLMAWLLTSALLFVYLGVVVERSFSSVRGAFKSYLHPGLVDRLTQSPDLLRFGGEEKELTILFSDIRNFTNMSETLSPQQLARFLNCYMDPMTEQVFQSRGTLDKYIGDAVMAFFGAPYPSHIHPANACECALGMLARLQNIKNCCPELEHLFPLRIGIGIHTGEAVVGNFGSSKRFNYTVLGDNVNLASRLEGMSKAYGVDIVVSETTFAATKGKFAFRELDKVRVKGKEVPITLYELRGTSDLKGSEQEEKYLVQWAEALSAYQQQDWEKSLECFESLYAINLNDKSCELYINRVKQYIENPPPEDWDGVYRFTTK